MTKFKRAEQPRKATADARGRVLVRVTLMGKNGIPIKGNITLSTGIANATVSEVHRAVEEALLSEKDRRPYCQGETK